MNGFTLLECIISSLLSMMILSFLFSVLHTYKKSFLTVYSLSRVQRNAVIAFTELENDIKNSNIQFKNKILTFSIKNHQVQYFIADTQRKNNRKETILGFYRYDSLHPRFAEEILEDIEYWHLLFSIKDTTIFLTAEEVDEQSLWKQVDGVFVQLNFKGVTHTLFDQSMVAYVQN